MFFTAAAACTFAYYQPLQTRVYEIALVLVVREFIYMNSPFASMGYCALHIDKIESKSEKIISIDVSKALSSTQSFFKGYAF